MRFLAILLVLLAATSIHANYTTYLGWQDEITDQQDWTSVQGPNGQLYIYALEENTVVSVFTSIEQGEEIATPTLIDNIKLEKEGDFVSWQNDENGNGVYGLKVGTQEGFQGGKESGSIFLKIVSDKPILWETTQVDQKQEGINDYHTTIISINGSFRGKRFYTNVRNIACTEVRDPAKVAAADRLKNERFGIFNPSDEFVDVNFWRYRSETNDYDTLDLSVTIPPGKIGIALVSSLGVYRIQSSSDILLSRGNVFPGTGSDNNDWLQAGFDWKSGEKIGREMYGQYGGWGAEDEAGWDDLGAKIIIHNQTAKTINYALDVTNLPYIDQSYINNLKEDYNYCTITPDTNWTKAQELPQGENWRNIHNGTLGPYEFISFDGYHQDSAQALFHNNSWDGSGGVPTGFFRVKSTGDVMAVGGSRLWGRRWTQGEILLDVTSRVPLGKQFRFAIGEIYNENLTDGPSLAIVIPDKNTTVKVYKTPVGGDEELFGEYTSNANDVGYSWPKLGNNCEIRIEATGFIYCYPQSAAGKEKTLSLSQITVSRLLNIGITQDADSIAPGQVVKMNLVYDADKRLDKDNNLMQLTYMVPTGFTLLQTSIIPTSVEGNKLFWDMYMPEGGGYGSIEIYIKADDDIGKPKSYMSIVSGSLPDYMKEPKYLFTTIFVKDTDPIDDPFVPANPEYLINISADTTVTKYGKFLPIQLKVSNVYGSLVNYSAKIVFNERTFAKGLKYSFTKSLDNQISIGDTLTLDSTITLYVTASEPTTDSIIVTCDDTLITKIKTTQLNFIEGVSGIALAWSAKDLSEPANNPKVFVVHAGSTPLYSYATTPSGQYFKVPVEFSAIGRDNSTGFETLQATADSIFIPLFGNILGSGVVVAKYEYDGTVFYDTTATISIIDMQTIGIRPNPVILSDDVDLPIIYKLDLDTTGSIDAQIYDGYGNLVNSFSGIGKDGDFVSREDENGVRFLECTKFDGTNSSGTKVNTGAYFLIITRKSDNNKEEKKKIGFYIIKK